MKELYETIEKLEKELDKHLEEIKYWKSIADRALTIVEQQQLEIIGYFQTKGKSNDPV